MRLIVFISVAAFLSACESDWFGIGCTHEVKWLVDGHVSGEVGSHGNPLVKIQSDGVLMSFYDFDVSRGGIHSLVYIRNIGGDMVWINGLRYIVNMGGVFYDLKPFKYVDISECLSQPCSDSVFDGRGVVLGRGSVIRVSMKGKIDRDGEGVMGDVEVGAKIKRSGYSDFVVVKKTIDIRKYESRYNCIFGGGHDFRYYGAR